MENQEESKEESQLSKPNNLKLDFQNSKVQETNGDETGAIIIEP